MLIIHDARIPDEYLTALKKELPDADLFPFKGIPGRTYDSISCHPDIYLFQIDEKTVVHAPGISQDDLRPLKDMGIELVKGEKDPGGLYPETVRYNAARAGNILFHNLEYTDTVILELAREKGLKCVNVKQGYTRCSILEAGDNAIITEDKGIAEAAEQEGVEVLLVAPGQVELPGERHGFIGGTSGHLSGRMVIFLGGIDTHAQAEEIRGFMRRCVRSIIELPGRALYDAGGLICFETGHGILDKSA
jgi:hypothetical protein